MKFDFCNVVYEAARTYDKKKDKGLAKIDTDGNYVKIIEKQFDKETGKETGPIVYRISLESLQNEVKEVNEYAKILNEIYDLGLKIYKTNRKKPRGGVETAQKLYEKKFNK